MRLIDDAKFLKDLGGGLTCRNNLRSPHGAIVIDPVCAPSLIAAADRYPQLDADNKYAASNNTSGSITIEGCAIFGFTVGIVVSPTTTQNAESIFVRDTALQCVRVGVAICQSQARNFVIENVAADIGLFFVTTRMYGGILNPLPPLPPSPPIGASGTPPYIHKCSISRHKYIFNVHVDSGILHVSSLYAETTLSIGYIGVGPNATGNTGATLTGCQFDFWVRAGRQIDFHCWNSCPLTFIGSSFMGKLLLI